MKCEKCTSTDMVELDAVALICPECGAQRAKVEAKVVAKVTSKGRTVGKVTMDNADET